MAAPPRDYIAITKVFLGSFLLDPGTYLRELEYFCFQEATKCKIMEKLEKCKLKFFVTLLMNPTTFA
jgi:hypothetical protein